MSKQSINTLKGWFITKAKPLAVQFWHWMDSYWHKDEMIPSASIDGLQELLDTKMDKKAVVTSDQVGVYDTAKNYVYDALKAEYVSFSNANSEDPQFQTEKFYRLKEDAPAGENPEMHPDHWAYQGTTIGEITIDDVIGLQEELDNKVDKVIGKGLSTEDYTTEEKNKLAALNEHYRGTSQERFSLIGHTIIPTAFDEAVSISSVPKYLNLSDIKLINLSDSSEIAILTASTLEELPIAVPAGDYNYSLTYESGKESGVLLINFS